MGKQEQVPARAIFVQGSLCGGWRGGLAGRNYLAFLRHSPPIPGVGRFFRGIPAGMIRRDMATWRDIGCDATIRDREEREMHLRALAGYRKNTQKRKLPTLELLRDMQVL